VTKDYVLITRLRQGEELNFSAKVVKKTAKDHAAFSAVSLCAFHYNEDRSKTAEMTSILEKERTYLKNTFGDPTSVHFAIEPETGLSPKYIVSKAIKILIEKLQTVRSELDVSESTMLSVAANTKIDDTFDLHINNEDDTLGNLFQSIVYNHFIRTNARVLNDKYAMSYVGYYAPHPLDKKIVIRMTLKGAAAEEEDYIAVLKVCLGIIENTLTDVLDDWMTIVS
jgi:DNA-directed RNA polymerase subunit L